MKTASFTLFVLVLCLTAHARAADCRKARAYLDFAENARSDVNAYAREHTDTGKDLGDTSKHVGEHFLDQAAQYFQGDECGSVTYLRYLAYRWDFGQGTGGDELVYMEPAQIATEVRIGHAILHEWQARGLDRAYPTLFHLAVQQFGVVQAFAAASAVNPTTGALPRSRPRKPSPHSAACAQPNRNASISNPVQPDYPKEAAELGLGPVEVWVAVTIDASGKLVRSAIRTSSSNTALDFAALRAAQESTYLPKLLNCAPTQSDLIIREQFTSN